MAAVFHARGNTGAGDVNSPPSAVDCYVSIFAEWGPRMVFFFKVLSVLLQPINTTPNLVPFLTYPLLNGLFLQIDRGF